MRTVPIRVEPNLPEIGRNGRAGGQATGLAASERLDSARREFVLYKQTDADWSAQEYVMPSRIRSRWVFLRVGRFGATPQPGMEWAQR